MEIMYSIILRKIKKVLYGIISSEKIFSYIYENNVWKDKESISGPGSNLKQTLKIRKEIPLIIKEKKIRTLLDIPCGDFNWMRYTDLTIEKYIGGDIVEKLIFLNQKRYGNNKHHFEKMDVTKDKLPKVDLIFCRDCLVHLPLKDIFHAIENFKRSKSKYLLTTTFTSTQKNKDIIRGNWRPINLEQPPFNLKEPTTIINEDCSEQNRRYRDKSLGLWKIKDL